MPCWWLRFCSQGCLCLSSGPEGPQVLVEPSLGAELHWQCWVTLVFAVLPPLFWQKTGPGSPAGSGAPCACRGNGKVGMQSQDNGMVKHDD